MGLKATYELSKQKEKETAATLEDAKKEAAQNKEKAIAARDDAVNLKRSAAAMKTKITELTLQMQAEIEDKKAKMDSGAAAAMLQKEVKATEDAAKEEIAKAKEDAEGAVTHIVDPNVRYEY